MASDAGSPHGRRNGRRPTILLSSSGRRLIVDALAHVLVDGTSGVKLASEPAFGREAVLDRCSSLRPAIILHDIDGSSPSQTISLLREMKRRCPETKVMLLIPTRMTGDPLLVEYVDAGADAFADRTDGLQALLDAILSVARGESFVPQIEVVEMLRAATHELEATRRASRLVRALTSRELEVLGLMVRGFSNEEIAEELHISVRTVTSHAQNVFRKMEVHSRLQAVAVANELDLVTLGDAE